MQHSRNEARGSSRAPLIVRRIAFPEQKLSEGERRKHCVIVTDHVPAWVTRQVSCHLKCDRKHLKYSNKKNMTSTENVNR